MAVNDLNIDQTIDKDYILLTIKDLVPGQTYPIQFRWKHADGTFGEWSPARTITPPSESAPGVPNVTVSGATPGMITVSWDGKDTAGNTLNVKEVDVYFSGSPFNSSVPAVVLTKASTVQQTAPAGQYGVTAYAITARGGASTPKVISGGVTVTGVGPVIEAPTNPNGFTSRRILAGIEVSWAGTYANGTFSGFKGIKIYAGTSSSATSGTYTEVGVLTGDKVKNTIVVPVDGTYVKYDQATYIHAAAVNQNGTVGTIQANVTSQSSGPGKATDADINDGAVVISKLASDVLTVGNLKAGDINATSYVRAGTAGSARVEMSSSTVGSVLPGLTIYGSDGTTQLLRAPLTGGLTINADGKFTGDLEVGSGSSIFKSDSNGIYLGSDTWSGAASTFRVSRTGYLTASYGEIGGISIGASSIGSSTFNLSSSGLALGTQSSTNSNVLISSSGIAHRGGLSNGSYISYATNSGRFTFDASTGYISIAAGTDPKKGARVIFDNDGIRAYNANDVKTIDINGGGSATFKGTIYATSGEFTGSIKAASIDSDSTINGATITGGIIQTASGSVAKVTINETANAINIYPDTTSLPGVIKAGSYLTSNTLKISSPYPASGWNTSAIQLFSLGTTASNSVGYIQIDAGATIFTGNVSMTGTSNFSLDAEFFSNIVATGAINATTLTPAPNVYMTTGGQIRRTSGSSIRYKEDVVDLSSVNDLNPNKLYDLPIRAFKFKKEFTSPEDSRYDRLVPGFIAEEVEEFYSIAADYDTNGVEKWNANIMIPAMLYLIQDLKARLDALEG